MREVRKHRPSSLIIAAVIQISTVVCNEPSKDVPVDVRWLVFDLYLKSTQYVVKRKCFNFEKCGKGLTSFTAVHLGDFASLPVKKNRKREEMSLAGA